MKRYLFVAVLLLLGVAGTAQADNTLSEVEAFKRLAAKAMAGNMKDVLPPPNTIPLGLGERGLPVQQLKFRTGTEVHAFSVSTDGSEHCVLFSRIDSGVYAFVLDFKLRLTGAAIRQDGQILTVPVDSVRPQLRYVVARWMDWAAKNTP